jgi:hypothetical protein
VSYERRDPDDPDRHGEPTASDVDAAFALIIARWDEDRPAWPAEHPVEDGASDTASDSASGTASDSAPDAASLDAASLDAASVDAASVDAASVDAASTEEIPTQSVAEPVDDDDDHYVPPEPPPLPRPQPATVGAVLLFALGIVLLAFPNVIGLSDQYGLPLGLLAITGAIVWLVARLRQGPPTDSGWDDGAQL